MIDIHCRLFFCSDSLYQKHSIWPKKKTLSTQIFVLINISARCFGGSCFFLISIRTKSEMRMRRNSKAWNREKPWRVRTYVVVADKDAVAICKIRVHSSHRPNHDDKVQFEWPREKERKKESSCFLFLDRNSNLDFCQVEATQNFIPQKKKKKKIHMHDYKWNDEEDGDPFPSP